MKLGVTQYTAAGDGKNFVEAAARMGFAAVEPCITSAESDFLKYSPQQMRQLRSLADKHGVQIPSVAFTHFNGDASIVTNGGSGAAAQLLHQALQFAHSLGANVLMICTFLASHPDTSEKQSFLLKTVDLVEPAATAFGITLALETPIPAPALADLLDGAASRRIRAYYDFGNAIAMGLNPADEIRLLGKRIIQIHAKDSANGKLASLQFGKGELNLSETMQAVQSIGFDGWLLLETPASDDAMTMRQRDVLKSLLTSS